MRSFVTVTTPLIGFGLLGTVQGVCWPGAVSTVPSLAAVEDGDAVVAAVAEDDALDDGAAVAELAGLEAVAVTPGVGVLPLLSSPQAAARGIISRKAPSARRPIRFITNILHGGYACHQGSMENGSPASDESGGME